MCGGGNPTSQPFDMRVGVRIVMRGSRRVRRFMVGVIRMEGKCVPMGDERKASRPTTRVHNHVRGSEEKGDDHPKFRTRIAPRE